MSATGANKTILEIIRKEIKQELNKALSQNQSIDPGSIQVYRKSGN